MEVELGMFLLLQRNHALDVLGDSVVALDNRELFKAGLSRVHVILAPHAISSVGSLHGLFFQPISGAFGFLLQETSPTSLIFRNPSFSRNTSRSL
jgi:hypothetical protein